MQFIKFVFILSLFNNLNIQAAQNNDQDEKIRQDDQKHQQLAITISLPPAVTNMPNQIALAGEKVCNSLNASAQLLSNEANKAIQGITQAGNGVSQTINNSVTALTRSVENGVNNVESAVGRFSNIIILKFCSLAAILMGMNMIQNNSNVKGFAMFFVGLMILIKGDTLLGKFQMHGNKNQ